MVSEPAGLRLGPAALTAALETQPDGAAVFDAAWTICYVNPAGAAALGRRTTDLIGRNLWVALPEAAGSILLHARGIGTLVTWQGFYPPASRKETCSRSSTTRAVAVSQRCAGG